MNNTANGGRQAIKYHKDNIDIYIRFNVVNNRRTMTTYINVWAGDVKVGQTYDCKYGDKGVAMKRAEKILEDAGYTK